MKKRLSTTQVSKPGAAQHCHIGITFWTSGHIVKYCLHFGSSSFLVTSEQINYLTSDIYVTSEHHYQKQVFRWFCPCNRSTQRCLSLAAISHLLFDSDCSSQSVQFQQLIWSYIYTENNVSLSNILLLIKLNSYLVFQILISFVVLNRKHTGIDSFSKEILIRPNKWIPVFYSRVVGEEVLVSYKQKGTQTGKTSRRYKPGRMAMLKRAPSDVWESL